MKSRHLVLAAVLLSSGWSSQVAYKKHLTEVRSKAHASRSIASQLEQLSLENIEEEAQEISNLSLKLKRSKEELVEELKKQDVKDLIRNAKKDKLDEIAKTRDLLMNRLQKAEQFISELNFPARDQITRVPVEHRENLADKAESEFQESDGVDAPPVAPPRPLENKEEIEKLLADSRKRVDEFNIVDFENTLDEALIITLEEKSIAKDIELERLESRVCSQKSELESLTAKVERLLKDKEEVVDEMDDKKKDKEKLKNSEYANYLHPALFMNPSQFFSQGFMGTSQGPDYSFLSQSSPFGNMGGMDMNFLMLTSMLNQNSGFGSFGGKSQLTYAPIYNNNQTYAVPSSFINQGQGAMNLPLNGQAQNMQGDPMMMNPFIQQQGESTQGMIPSYPRSNALQSNNMATQNNPGLSVNAQKLFN